jgi:hypothetical protein
MWSSRFDIVCSLCVFSAQIRNILNDISIQSISFIPGDFWVQHTQSKGACFMKKIFRLPILMAVLTLSAFASKHIVVNLSQQRACAYERGRTVFCGNISSGKPGHRTPVGRFRVLEKDIDHVSSKYPEPNGGAKMHYMLRLTGSGIAMHLGHVPNYPASHGCIRMQSGFAQRMYRWASVGTPVQVIGTPPRRVSRSGSRHYAPMRRLGADDRLASIMGFTRHHAKRSGHLKKRSRHHVRRSKKRHQRRSRRRSKRHAHPLETLASR